jgi:hypothetical protein
VPGKRIRFHSVNRKAQSEIMEYIFLTLFIIIMIVVLILFLSWFQYSQIGMKGSDIKKERGEFLMNYFINSPYLNQPGKNSMFDDSKLTALMGMECSELQGIYGEGWSLRIEMLTSEPNCYGECTQTNYPCCGTWSFCWRESNSTMKYVIPVNVVRHMTGRIHLANMEVSVHD